MASHLEIFALTLVLSPFGGGHSPTPPHAPPALCAAPDEYAAAMLARIQAVVTASDTGAVAFRARFKWPPVVASAVIYVTDNAICAPAEAVYTPVVQRVPPATPSGVVYVFKIGTVYWVHDTAQADGRLTPTATLDKRFKVLAVRKL